MDIIPKLNGKIVEKEGTFSLASQLTVFCGDFECGNVELLQERLQAKILFGIATAAQEAQIELIRKQGLPLEGYEIEVESEKIRLFAASETGMKWAFSTLYQRIALALRRGQAYLKNGGLDDVPQYPHRGLSVDVARHFFPLKTIKSIIEQMALCKMNIFHWHLSDDQGFRIESKVHPLLTPHGSQFYTQQEIQELVAFASVRGVQIIPEIDLPGHVTAILHAYPALSCSGEPVSLASQGGIYKDILCTGKESVFAWLTELWEEIVSLFPSPYFHVGGDEALKYEWENCPSCQERIQELNLSGFEDLQGWFVSRAAQYLQAKGKIVIGWNECLKAANLDGNIVAQYWTEHAPHSYCLPAIQSGRKMIFSDMFALYYDYPYAAIPLQYSYEYEPGLEGKSLRDHPMVQGIEGAIWSERIKHAEDLERMLFPRVQALAECCWTKEREYGDFERRLKLYLPELVKANIPFTPLPQANLKGDERTQQAVLYFAGLLEFAKQSKMPLAATKEQQDDTMAEILEHFLNGFFNPQEAEYVRDYLFNGQKT